MICDKDVLFSVACFGGLRMQKRWLILLVLLAVVVVTSGCATIFYSDRARLSPSQRGSLDVGMFILDIFWFPWGWIIDFLTGCIWTPAGGY